MASYNKIILIGYLGGDPLARDYEGKKVANFSIAVNAYVRPDEEPKVDWFRVSFWNNNAEVVEKYLRKGNQVYVEGRLSTRTYIDESGQSRFSLDVHGHNLTMLGSKNDGGDPDQNNDNDAPQNNTKKEETNTAFDAEKPDNLPF